VKVDLHLVLRLRLRMSGDKYFLLLYAFMVWTGKPVTFDVLFLKVCYPDIGLVLFIRNHLPIIISTLHNLSS